MDVPNVGGASRSSSPFSSVVEDTHQTDTATQVNRGSVHTNVPFNKGESNLQVEQSEESIVIDFVNPSDSDPFSDAVTKLLTQAEVADLENDAMAFVKSLAELSSERLASLPPSSSRPASNGEVVKGVVLGGIAGYSVMFVAAQVVSKLATVYSPLAGAVSFPIVTALLRALIPEPGAGMRRDLDGKAVTNYVTALAEWIAAKLEGDPAKEMIYEKAMKDIVASVTKRMQEDPELGLAFKDNPMLGAYIRDLVTKLSILSLGIAFTLSGSALPFIRQRYGAEPILSAVIDIAASAAAGFLGGMGTAFFANLLRDKVQHAPPAQGLLSKDDGVAMKARIDAKLAVFKENDDKLLAIEEVARAHIASGVHDAKGEANFATLLDKIEEVRNHIARKSEKLSEMSQRYSSPGFRAQPDKPTWAQGWPAARQAMATGLGVAVALSSFAYLIYGFEEHNTAAGNMDSVAGDINSVMGYSIGVGFGLVGAFAPYQFISHPLQLGMGALAGLGRRARDLGRRHGRGRSSPEARGETHRQTAPRCRQ